MSTVTRVSEMNTFKLAGHEIQERINLDKYNAIVYQSEGQGPKLRELVEHEWSSWLKIVEEAPWLSHWKNSQLLDQVGFTPNGVETSYVTRKGTLNADLGALALTIYCDACWGFAIEQWLKFPWGQKQVEKVEKENVRKEQTKGTPTLMQRRIMELQKLKAVPVDRKNTWDKKIYLGTGMLIPVEYGDLDRWLENLWNQIS